jgi:hypothetical protein
MSGYPYYNPEIIDRNYLLLLLDESLIIGFLTFIDNNVPRNL